MKAMKVTSNQTFERIDEDWTTLVELSRAADVECVLCLEETTSRGYMMAYRDGRAEQYDPVTSRFI